MMINVLVAEDEPLILNSITKLIHSLDSDFIVCARAKNGLEVLQCLNSQPINIIFTDIKMPLLNGLDLIQEIRNRSLKVPIVILSGNNDFSYAKKTLKLGVFDYLLKPIDFDKLKEAVQRAAESVAKEKKIQDLRQESIKWNQNRKILQQDIWKNVLKDGFSEEKFCETAAQRQLPYGPGHYFRLICLMPEIKSNKREMWDTATMEFVIENVLSELYEETDIAVDTVFYQEPGSYWIVTQSKEKAFPQDGERDCEILRQFVAWMNEKIYLELWCGVGQWESVLGMQKQSRNLQKMREGSLSVRNEVLFLNEFQAPQTSYENKELDVWKALLSEEKPEELLERLQKYLDRTEREGMITRELLVALRTDLTQVVYAWLSEREIKAYALFADADMENLHRNSLYGREEMMEYAGVLVRKAVQYRQYINKSDSVTSQVCAYIDAHYREEIHREELGELVFLNTDYLSRIFKKEKGISISNYIIQKRVEEAKKLLTQSTLPINTVSLYVGYSNFSYFTKMFKDNTGYAPLEYRRSFSEK